MAGVWVIKVCDDVEGVNDEVGVIVSTIYQAMYIHVVNYCIIHSIAILAAIQILITFH